MTTRCSPPSSASGVPIRTSHSGRRGRWRRPRAESWAQLHYELYRNTLGPDRLAWTPEEHVRDAGAARSAVELALRVKPWMVLHQVARLLAADMVDNVLTAGGPFAARVRDPRVGARLPAVASALAEAPYDVEPLGQVTFKGIAVPVPVFLVG